MFYTDKPDFNNLRFGDVIKGFVGVIPIIEIPFNETILKGYDFEIKTYIPEYSVVMTHCCSIGKGNLALAHYKKVGERQRPTRLIWSVRPSWICSIAPARCGKSPSSRPTRCAPSTSNWARRSRRPSFS